MDNSIAQRIEGLKSFVGNTPLLAIDFTYKGEKRVLYAKAENMNMTGSIKDRMAFHIIKQGYKKGTLKPGDQMAEATSGNTGIAISAIGRALGHQVTIFMPDWMSSERINLIKSFGANIRLVSKEEGGFKGSIEMANAMNEKEGAFLPSQFSNEDNVEAHYKTTGPEIWWQFRRNNMTPEAFIAGVGTGGTIMGAGKFLKEKNPSISLHPLEPSNSPTMTTGGEKIGSHRIQGISDEFIPPIVKLEELDDIISVDDGDSIIMAQKIAGSLGIGVGISSGANFIGALMRQNELGKDSVVVTVFSDDNKKYLSTDLMKEEPVKEGFLSPDVELLGFRSLKRVCHTCCDPKECGQIEPPEDFLQEILDFTRCPLRKGKG
jgi:cysteine synthase A